MKASYPKPPRHIKIRITHRAIQDGLLSEIKTTAEVPLNVKLNDYVVRLGYSSTDLIGSITQLFTTGKVRIDFPTYTERLELVDEQDALTPGQVMSLLADFIAEIESAGVGDFMSHKGKATQQIIIKKPNVT